MKSLNGLRMQFIYSETVRAIIKIPPDSPAVNNFHSLREIAKKYGAYFLRFLNRIIGENIQRVVLNKIHNISFTRKNMKNTLFLIYKSHKFYFNNIHK